MQFLAPKKINSSLKSKPTPINILTQDSLLLDTLEINAINLSEDMSRLSTMNDEIFVFIYDYSDTNILSKPVVSKKIVLDKNHSTYKINIPKKKPLILFFIEEDSFRNMEQIEPVVRIYFKEIMKVKDDYNLVKKYLGEDDILGIKIIHSTTKKFEFTGINSLDRFHYKLFILKE